MSLVRLADPPARRRRISTNDGGFSLIEVLAALFIFTLLTLGLVPLLTSSIRGSNTARADTIGKNAALKAMERVRGLPFFVSYATSTTKVDLLDLYYPDAATDIVAAGRTLYRITCPWNNLVNPACPRDVPNNYTITFEAQFVDPVATGTQPTPGETATSYQNVVPPTTYAWSSASTDTPPRQIVQMTVMAEWTVGAGPERYSLTSLLSDRSFGGRKIKATATVGYGLDVYTAYDSNPAGGSRLSSANAFVVSSESDIEGRRLSTSRQTTTAIRGELQQDAGGSLGSVVGATSNLLQAPPDQDPGTTTSAQNALRHPEFPGNPPLMNFGPSAVIEPAALAASAAPSGVGDAEITGGVGGGTQYVTFPNPQLQNPDYLALQLTVGAPIISVVRNDGLAGPLPGITSPVTTGDVVVGGTRASTRADSAYAQATTGVDRILMFDTNWPELSDTEAVAEGGTLTGLGHLIVIDDFQASVTCDSGSDGTGDGEAQYQGTLYYWEDPAQNGDRNDGRYRRVTFNVTSATAGADPLAAIMAQNPSAGQSNGPLIYDHPSANLRLYLFGKTLGAASGGSRRGGDVLAYMRNWNSLTTASSRVETSTDAAGAAVAAVDSTIDGAIELETADLDVDRRDVGAATVSIGSVSCYSQDAR